MHFTWSFEELPVTSLMKSGAELATDMADGRKVHTDLRGAIPLSLGPIPMACDVEDQWCRSTMALRSLFSLSSPPAKGLDRLPRCLCAASAFEYCLVE
jgi:hypothetical protein